MKWIKIKNKGMIQPEALHLMGGTTKTNDSTKIGQFGSGNKYALAYLLRNGYNVKIFSGLEEIKIETKSIDFRNNDFEVIYINGERTSITTKMGKDWEFWQSIREVYCNAIDEGENTMDFVSNISPVEGETHFYISMSKDVSHFVTNFDNYFAHNKQVLFESKFGKILPKSGDTANVYRKGIRCFNTNKTSVFDYDLNEIDIDENRLIKYSWQTDEKIWELIFSCDNEEIIYTILNNCSNKDFIESCISDYSNINSSQISETFKKCLRKTRLAPIGFAGLLNPDEVKNHIIIPTKIYSAIRGVIGDENVGDKFKTTIRGAFFREIKELSSLQKASLKQVDYFFNEVGFKIPYEIKIAIFDDKNVLGTANNGIIYLSDICMEKGINEIANTILEEYIHIKYNVSDETRSFQTSLITEFISYMKQINSFVI